MPEPSAALAAPVTLEPRDGFVALRLTAPPRNILDGRALDAIADAAAALRGEAHRGARAVLLCADGPSFSVGAAVAEHTRAEAPRMLQRFHRAITALLATDLPLVAAVRGACLGGGLELVLPATRIIAAPGATLGQPEIRLGALAPVASVLLPRRIGQARAEQLLLTGRTLDAATALAYGLIDEVAEDPEAAATAWIAEALRPLSASSLRLACRAARAAQRAELDALLPRLEALYVGELSPTHDAEEGVTAFLAKRTPRWEVP
jgi:cyclohexa-1,5-dienecarbonyl-CoA hydratase